MTKEDVLKQYFGYSRFRPLQAEIIDTVLAGQDALVIMPTGGGKSICFQTPAMLLPGMTVVVSPLIALMQDQVRALDAVGIPAAFLNSSISYKQQQEVTEACMQGKIRLLYVSPEKLLSQGFFSFLDAAKVSLFAVDESHCISFWGHDFRPEYTQLHTLKSRFPGVPVLALTATADKLTRSDILRQLAIPDAQVFLASFDRPNLSLQVLPGRNRIKTILEFVRQRPGQPGIIYCLSRASTEELAGKLAQEGISARHYHAGMDAAYRRATQDAFTRDQIQVMTATIAFGMGIDKPNIRWIIHYNLPGNVESYYQEIGRAGRDGLPSDTLLFYSFGDVITRRNLIADSALEPELKELQEAKLDRMRQYAEAAICRRRVLLSYFNESLDRDCGNCDVCTHPPQRFDGTILAQKALSAIARTQEQVAMGMLIDILRGSRNQQLLKLGYDQIKTFGTAREIREADWTDYLLQMLNSGLVDIAYDEGHAFRLNAASREVLRGQRQVMLVRHEAYQAPEARKKPAPVPELTPAQRFAASLETRLRSLRSRLAAEWNVPAYVVFNDVTLGELTAKKPLTRRQLAEISGMGQERMARLGQLLLDELREAALEDPAEGAAPAVKHRTYFQTLAAFRKGASLEEIALERKLSASTVVNHLAWLRDEGEPIRLTPLIDAGLRERILNTAKRLNMKPSDPVRPLFDALGEEVPFEQLRLALASWEEE
jgi:ATP-dependent DNA helicase RecQ